MLVSIFGLSKIFFTLFNCFFKLYFLNGVFKIFYTFKVTEIFVKQVNKCRREWSLLWCLASNAELFATIIAVWAACSYWFDSFILFSIRVSTGRIHKTWLRCFLKGRWITIKIIKLFALLFSVWCLISLVRSNQTKHSFYFFVLTSQLVRFVHSHQCVALLCRKSCVVGGAFYSEIAFLIFRAASRCCWDVKLCQTITHV